MLLPNLSLASQQALRSIAISLHFTRSIFIVSTLLWCFCYCSVNAGIRDCAMPSFVLCDCGINNKVMCVDECLWPIARYIAGLFEQELWVGFVEIPSHWAVL